MNKLISISPQRLPKSTTKGNGKNEMLYIKQLTLILNLKTDSYALPISLLILRKKKTTVLQSYVLNSLPRYVFHVCKFIRVIFAFLVDDGVVMSPERRNYILLLRTCLCFNKLVQTETQKQICLDQN